MNTTMSNTSAYSLIGREVIIQKADETGQYKETRGVVDYVGFENGEAVISVDGKKFSMEDIVKVLDTVSKILLFLTYSNRGILFFALPLQLLFLLESGKSGTGEFDRCDNRRHSDSDDGC